MSVTTIQPVQPHQLDLLQHLAKTTFYESFVGTCAPEDMTDYLETQLTLPRLQSEFQNPESQFYFGYLDSEAVGYLKINMGEAQTENQPGGFEIERIYLLQAAQRKGVGQALLDHALTLASSYKADYVWLGVWEHNHKALSFYRKNGFKPFGEHIFQMGSDPQTDLLLKRNL